MPKPRPVPSRDILLLALNELGSQSNVAEMLGASQDLMTTWLRLRSIRRGDYVTARYRSFSAKMPDKDDLLSMIDELKTLQEVANHCGVRERTVSRWCAAYDIDLKRSRLTAKNIPLIRELQSYMSAEYVAKNYKVSPRAIRRVWNGETWGDVA